MFDFSDPKCGGEEVVGPEVKRVDESLDVIKEACESCGGEEVVSDVRASEVLSHEEVEQISSALDSLHVEENFVWKHGVLESWHLVGKKVAKVDDAKGVGDASSSGKKVEEVASFDGGKKGVSRPPDIRQVRRGRTLFDWGAFNLEMKERCRVEDPP